MDKHPNQHAMQLSPVEPSLLPQHATTSSPLSLLSLARFEVTVGDKIRRHVRCQADHMMILPGSHSKW
eukprot:4254972-Pleurochrysis_carterae.AAC.1